MYNNNGMYPCPYDAYESSYSPYDPYNADSDYWNNQYRYMSFDDDCEYNSIFVPSRLAMNNEKIALKDYGPQPFVVNIDEASKQNKNFRTGLWTGSHLQVTLMSINVGDDIGLEVHPNVDQFIRIEDGQATVRMGKSKDNLDFKTNAYNDFAIMIPAGTWHNVINIGKKPLKLYSIYAPPQHPHGVVNVTKPSE